MKSNLRWMMVLLVVLPALLLASKEFFFRSSTSKNSLSIMGLRPGLHRREASRLLSWSTESQLWSKWNSGDGGSVHVIFDSMENIERVSVNNICDGKFVKSDVVKLFDNGQCVLSYGATLAESSQKLGHPDFFLETGTEEQYAVFPRQNLILSVVDKKIVGFILDSNQARLSKR